jgi:hypothetical protein
LPMAGYGGAKRPSPKGRRPKGVINGLSMWLEPDPADQPSRWSPPLRSVSRIESLDDTAQDRKSVPGAIGFALLEVGAFLAHGVGDMRETK